MLTYRPLKTKIHQVVTIYDKLCCSGERQPKRQACCVVQHDQKGCLLVTDCHPKQSETGWVMQEETPSTWQTSLSHTFLPGSSVRLWRRSSPPVHFDHTAAGLLVTVCLSLSALTRRSSPLFWCPLFPPVRQQWAECNNAGTKRTHLQIQTYTDKHKENDEGRGGQRDAYWIWTKRCRVYESLCLGRRRMQSRLYNHENTPLEGRAEQRRSQPKQKRSKICLSELKKKLPTLKTWCSTNK